jgi:ketosteroid isomerase-like protein
MKKLWVFLLIAALGGSLVGLAGCVSTPKTSPQAFEQAVKDIWVQYTNSWMAGDVDRWIQLWDVGGVQLPPNSPMKMNVAEIKKSSEAAQAAYKWKTFVINISGSFVDETYGFVYGNYVYTFAPRAGGAELTGDGKYETIFKKQANGSWKIFRDCFNSNLP